MNEVARVEQFSEEQKAIIKNTIAPNLTDDQMSIFLHNCVRTGLDPFSKQIYGIARGGKLCIQVAIDGFRVIAERTGKYSPGEDTQFLYDQKGNLMGAKVFVKKMTPDGTWHQISATAFLKEYDPGQGLWRKMPHVMIEKCAEARALRRAFPSDLSGLYAEEEMDQAKENKDEIVVKTPRKEAARISEESFSALDSFINGSDELRKNLKQICKVDDLRDITEPQLAACRKYVSAKRKKEREAQEQYEKQSNGE